MKSRTFYSAIALLAGLLVLIGVVGFWGLTAQNPKALIAHGGQEQPRAAQFVPRQSPVMVSLLARPDRLWQLRQLFTSANQRFAARQEWQSLQQSLEEVVGWNYDADVRPWLDEEATFAVTTADLDRDPSNGQQPGYLVVLSCRDAVAARAALHRLWQQRAAQGRNLVFATTAGVALISDRPLLPVTTSRLSSPAADLALDTLATTMVGDRYVLLANDEQVLRQAIATYSAPDVSLAQAPDHRAAIAALSPNRIGWVYCNVPNFLTWLGVETPEGRQPIKPAGQQAQGVFISLQALTDGLLGNTAIAPAPGASLSTPATSPSVENSFPASVFELLPENTLLATTGRNLSQHLASLDIGIGGYRFTQNAVNAIFESWSLTPTVAVPELASAWQGDYAIGLLPGSRPHWFVITEPSSSGDFAAIDDFAASQGLTVSRIPYGEQTITTWTRLALTRSRATAPLSITTEVVAVHAPRQGYEILSTSLEGLQRILQPAGPATLSGQPVLTRLLEELDPSGDNLTYLNWPALAPQLTRQFPWLQALEVAGRPLTNHIGPIVINASRPVSQLQIQLQMGTIAIKLTENPEKTS